MDLTKKAERQELYDFNQAIKTVYTFFSYIDGIIVPANAEAIKKPKLFKRSLFIHHIAEHPELLNDRVIDAEKLNKAIKGKMYEERYEDNKGFLRNSEEELLVSAKLKQEQIDDYQYYEGMQIIDELKEGYDYEFTMDEFTMSHLNNMEDYEILFGQYQGEDLTMIITRALFPVAKKVSSIQLFAKLADPEQRIFDVFIVSKAPTWTFYSKHKILMM